MWPEILYAVSLELLMMILEAVDDAGLLIREVPHNFVLIEFELILGIEMATLVYYVLVYSSYVC